MHLGGYCPGCGGGAGNQSCAIAKCSLEHGGVPFCWECPEYPCPRYEGFDDGDSFVPHRNRQQDIAQAREIGLEAYLAQLEEKRAILEKLLAHYNDGRRKTFFNTAVYLLPLEDLQSVMAALNSRPELDEQPMQGAGPCRCGAAPGGGGPPGHQPETEQETEEGVSRMPTSRVTVHFPCPVERVWQAVTDLTHTAWRSDLARVEVLDEAHFVEHTKSGYATNFTVTACEPPPALGLYHGERQYVRLLGGHL